DRSEIKDMVGYLKLVNNPDDSIALLRVINTPVRGIGRGTMETVERIALETGLSLWQAIGHAVRENLLPQRAVVALKAFHEIITDARAMLLGTFQEQLKETSSVPAVAENDDTSFAPEAFGQHAIDF